SPRLVRELTLRHQEMVQLMMRSLHHNAHETQRLEVGPLPRVVGPAGGLYSVWQVLGPRVPADLDEFADVRGNHTFDRLKRSTFTGHCDLDAVVERTLRCDGAQRYFVHVDQVLAQRGDVHL